jgi:hypothetical protein
MNPPSYSRRTHGFDSRLVCASLASLLTFCVTDAPGQSAGSVPSKARPFGLDIVAPEITADAYQKSEVSQQPTLPELTSYLKTPFGEPTSLTFAAYALDPGKLLLQTESEAREYFIGEGAGYRNTLGLNIGSDSDPTRTASRASTEPKAGTSKNKVGSNDKTKEKPDNTQASPPSAIANDGVLIFPDASSPLAFFDPAANAARRGTAPLLPGEFVNLGRLDAGNQLDFFLIANAAAGGTTTYSTQASLNADGIDHLVTFAYGLKDSPYIILGFENLYGGGDQDYNDLLFAVDMGRINLTALTATPEPSTYVVLGCLIPFGYYLKRRRDQQSAVTPTHQTP